MLRFHRFLYLRTLCALCSFPLKFLRGPSMIHSTIKYVKAVEDRTYSIFSLWNRTMHRLWANICRWINVPRNAVSLDTLRISSGKWILPSWKLMPFLVLTRSNVCQRRENARVDSFMACENTKITCFPLPRVCRVFPSEAAMKPARSSVTFP